MFGRAIDEERLQRREEILRRMSGAILSGSIFPEFRAQPVQNLSRPGYLGATDFQPLKLGQKVATRHRRQPLQKFLDRVSRCHCAAISANFNRCDRSARDMQARTRGNETIKTVGRRLKDYRFQ